MECIILDAMGVMFNAADDVAELLIPFIQEQGGVLEASCIQEAYLAASLGQLSADGFWYQVGLDPSLEDTYLSRHSTVAGLMEFLSLAVEMEIPVWCLSNDVGRWSKKLRSGFKLDGHLHGALVSGDVGYRKPSSAIYALLAKESGFQPSQMVFFDDREKNVIAAENFGIRSVLFKTSEGFSCLTERLRDGTL